MAAPDTFTADLWVEAAEESVEVPVTRAYVEAARETKREAAKKFSRAAARAADAGDLAEAYLSLNRARTALDAVFNLTLLLEPEEANEE